MNILKALKNALTRRIPVLVPVYTHTCFCGPVLECPDALDPIVALVGQRADVVPVEGPRYVHHGLGLERIRGNDSGEILKPGLVTQVNAGRGITYLGNLAMEIKTGNLLS